MTLYIVVDIHARQQTLSYLDSSDGTTGQVVLDHEQDDVREFYSQFQGEVIIGDRSQWLVRGVGGAIGLPTTGGRCR